MVGVPRKIHLLFQTCLDPLLHPPPPPPKKKNQQKTETLRFIYDEFKKCGFWIWNCSHVSFQFKL